MPMEPAPGESHSEFMSRCIEHEMGKGHPQEQAVAMCYSMSGEGKAVLGALEEKRLAKKEAQEPLDKKRAPGSERKPLPVVKLR